MDGSPGVRGASKQQLPSSHSDLSCRVDPLIESPALCLVVMVSSNGVDGFCAWREVPRFNLFTVDGEVFDGVIRIVWELHHGAVIIFGVDGDANELAFEVEVLGGEGEVNGIPPQIGNGDDMVVFVGQVRAIGLDHIDFESEVWDAVALCGGAGGFEFIAVHGVCGGFR